jgi:Cu/Ag efflux protein CusF
MSAMEMEFKVQDPSALSGISVGDQVHGHLEVKSGEYTLTELMKQ